MKYFVARFFVNNKIIICNNRRQTTHETDVLSFCNVLEESRKIILEFLPNSRGEGKCNNKTGCIHNINIARLFETKFIQKALFASGGKK